MKKKVAIEDEKKRCRTEKYLKNYNDKYVVKNAKPLNTLEN
jgi:hypothetical protein